MECQAFAIREVEKFYRKKGILDALQNELLKRKFIAKLPLLLDRNCRDVKRWRNLFPESNDVWRELDFSLNNKVTFWLSSSPLFWFINLYFYLKFILIGNY